MTRALSRRTINRLRGLGDAVLTRPTELLPYESDGLTLYRALPAAVVFVRSAEQVSAVLRFLHDERIPFVARGAGTGLSGGCVADGAVVIETARMNCILEIDAVNRRARVEPGVMNTQLGAAAQQYGLMYAPDPSSQTTCTLGGNVAENSGGPHCLKYGVTTNHILSLLIALPDGTLVRASGPDAPGYDLVGLFVGSEGTLGICCEIEVRLVPQPQAVETLLAHFDDLEAAGHAVSAIIAAGIVPAALEMIDRETIRAVESSAYAAGFPTDVAASLIVELDGPEAGLADQARLVESILYGHDAREVARAEGERDRTRFWQARKKAFGAMGRLGSDLLVQDATVPRSRLPEVLGVVRDVAREYDLLITNVFHAGDGNLHPNIPFDRRDPELTQRVHDASADIMRACVAAGGTITGEHGVGLDKRKYMRLIYSEDDLAAMRWVKQVFDPDELANPGKIFPPDADGAEDARARGVDEDAATKRAPSYDATSGDIASAVEGVLGRDGLIPKAEAFRVGGRAPEVVAAPSSLAELSELMKLASSRRWRLAPAGHGLWLDAGNPLADIDFVVSTRRLSGPLEHHPDDMLATVGAGVGLEELNERLASANQWWPLDPMGRGSVGAAIATDSAGSLAPTYGTPRDLTLGLSVVLADGRVVKAGGRVVKNVAGYDMVKLFTGSWGTLGVIAEAHLRLHPTPEHDATLVANAQTMDDLVDLASEIERLNTLSPAAAEIVSPDVARALGLRDSDCAIVLRWLGHEAAATEALDRAGDLAAARGLRVESDAAVWRHWPTTEDLLSSRLTMRLSTLPGALRDSLKEVTGNGKVSVVASPLNGRAWCFVDEVAYGERSQAEWVSRIESLRRAGTARGGFVRVERAPLDLRASLDAWGDASGTLILQRAIRKKFDPNGILNPGRFVGGA